MKKEFDNQSFKKLVLTYLDFYKKYRSVDILKKINGDTNQLRLRMFLSNKFILHSIGLQYAKELYKKYRNELDIFFQDIQNDRLTYQDLMLMVNENHKGIIIKKLNALKAFVYKISKIIYYKNSEITNAFEFFKIKPKSDENNTYATSEVILISKANKYDDKRFIIYGIMGNQYDLDISKNHKAFYNQDKTIINVIFVPISLKYKSFGNFDNRNYFKIDIAFLNHRSADYAFDYKLVNKVNTNEAFCS